MADARTMLLSFTLAAAVGSTAGSAHADEASVPQARTYTLDQAIGDALANHPRIRGSVADETAAEARIDEAKANRLPDVGVSAQLNRSTGNTAPGAFFPTTGFVPIGGPPRGKTFDGGVWETGASLWATWDVLSLTRQSAAIDVALAGRTEATASTAARRLEVAYRAGDAFLLLLEAQEAVRAAQANIERARVLMTVTRTLVDQSLRPGADAARADSELALAQTSLARAEQTRDVRRAQLAEAVGSATLLADAAPGELLGPIDSIGAHAATAQIHPDVVQANANVARATEAERLVDVEYLPRVDLVAALWARGSGYLDSPAAGLVPDIPNWAAGATVTWSVLDIPTIRARARVASAARSGAAARRDEVALAVAGQLTTSTAVLRGALNIARQTPQALASARAAEQQAAARFKTGLAPVVDVADAERILTQAEIDEAVAKLEVRRALLLVARASGDLGPFMAQSRARGP